MEENGSAHQGKDQPVSMADNLVDIIEPVT